jgi:ADP-heptose:LPS heptosyltransferase
MSRVVVRATNWLGDAVMSLPAIRAIRGVFPDAHLAVLARPWVADLYALESREARVRSKPSGRALRRRYSFAQLIRFRADDVDGGHS